MMSLTAPVLHAPVSPADVTRSVLIVANPTAGGFRYRALDRFTERLHDLGARVEVRLTRYAGDLVETARSVPASVDTLVVGGGDGSINEAIQGLLHRGPEAFPALAVLPFGTANVLAHELKLPFSPRRMAEAVIARETAPLHLGRVGDRRFLLMVSAGFDGDVVHAVDGPTKRRWGKLAYAGAALRLALARQGRDVIVEADGETHVCRLAVVTTARCYGGPLTITRGTDVTRPGLRLVMLKQDGPALLARAALALALCRLDRLPEVVDMPVERARFVGEDIRMQIDGDRMETSHAPIEAEARSIDVIVDGAGRA